MRPGPVLLAASVLLLAAGPAAACRLSVPPGLVGGRVAAFSLKAEGAAVRVPRSPPGWAVSVRKGLAGTVVSGRASHGAAFLSAAAWAAIPSLSPAPGAGCEALRPGLAVTLTVYRGDRLVEVPLDRRRLRLR